MQTSTPEVLSGRVCLITGASGALGKAASLALARSGANVVMACRDKVRGEKDRTEVETATGNKNIELLLLDLASQQSVREGAANFNNGHGKLDVLINNASVFKGRPTTTPDGLEAMFATNHLGHFLLTNLLLDELKASPQGRVITVTAPSTTKLNFDDLQGERKFSALSAFGASKMCNLLFTYALATRLAGTTVTSNALYPGLMKSNLMSEAPAPIRWLTRLFSSTPEQAAASLVQLASSPEVVGVTGDFFKDNKTIRSSEYSNDESIQKRLWDTSVALTGLT